MKIDFFISSLSGGGAEKVLITIAQKLVQTGNEVSIVSLEKRPQFYEIDPQVKVYKYPQAYHGIRALFVDFWNIRKHLRQRNADVNVSFMLRCNLLLLLADYFGKRKILVSDRNNPLKEHTRLMFFLQNIIYKRADGIIVQTNQIRSYYAKHLKDKITVIENPLDTHMLDGQIDKKPTREKVIIAMGRLESQKDYRTLLLAFSMISQKYPEWKVKIFGLGRMQEGLIGLRDALGLSERVLFCGQTTRPFFEMCKASIFVLSSFYEGFPNVLCEAMYAGDLCIASDCVSGPKELIDTGINGWLFPVKDVDRLKMLLELCIQREAALVQMRRNARKSVERLFLEQNIEKWEREIQI